LGEPRGLVGVYAARAAARDVDLRPIIAAHRADVDDVPNRAAARRGEDRPAVAAPVLLIGRGTSAHRAARGARPAGRSTDGAGPLALERRDAFGGVIDAVLARLGFGAARSRGNRGCPGMERREDRSGGGGDRNRDRAALGCGAEEPVVVC